ncbi:DUF4198 domain-containing protein [Stutzerimonas urumqiensis]|uniref:DUF4198 domain-containing protein n=1 Tax=Stutzerimonas urumqiensis TaxID=638269 RepID=UPI003DA50351
MLKPFAYALLLGTFALPATAHELWLERDRTGPVKLYLGEPDQGVLERGETIAALAPTTTLFVATPADAATLTVKDDHLEASVEGTGDVRATNDQVWKPWENDQGEVTAALMHARYGRTETKPGMDLELVPVRAGADRFTLLFKGEPLAENDVMLITPDNKAKELKTDASGQVTVPVEGAGRYIVASSHEVPANGQKVAGQAVDKLYYGTTTSFIAE